ncbi:MAG TPA: hypothetical protein VF486_11175 [Actinomycetes bacterium]
MQEPISRRAVLELAGAAATLAAGLLLGACRSDGNGDGGGNGGDPPEGGMGSGNRGRRRN